MPPVRTASLKLPSATPIAFDPSTGAATFPAGSAFNGPVTVAGAVSVAGAISANNLGWAGVLAATLKDPIGRQPFMTNDDFTLPVAYYQNAGPAPGGYYGNAYYSIPGIGAGQATLTTGSTATGSNNLANSYQFNPAKYSKVRGRIIFWLPQLSSPTDTFQCAVGGFSTVTGIPQASCMCAAIYTDGTNGGRFQIQTLAAAGYNFDDSGVTVVANKLYIFEYTLTPTNPGSSGNALTWTIYDAATLAVLGTATRTVNVVANSAGNGGSAPLAAGIVKSVGTTPCLIGLDHWQCICLP